MFLNSNSFSDKLEIATITSFKGCDRSNIKLILIKTYLP